MKSLEILSTEEGEVGGGEAGEVGGDETGGGGAGEIGGVPASTLVGCRLAPEEVKGEVGGGVGVYVGISVCMNSLIASSRDMTAVFSMSESSDAACLTWNHDDYDIIMM